MTRLLARYADGLFWLARYVERAESLARVLDVQETFARDRRGRHDWRAVLRLYGYEEAFDARYAVANAINVLTFYVLDPENPGSVVSCIAAARENARVLRHLISTEMWVQINAFYHRVRALGPADIAEGRLSRTCQLVKEGCETHAGITAGTFYRDEAWRFYELGAATETADQTTRLVDVRYQALARAERDGPAIDIGQWNALLRSAAGYQAFRRRHPRGLKPVQVATFLLCDPDFPRSVVHNLRRAHRALGELADGYGLPAARPIARELEELESRVDPRTVAAAVAEDRLDELDDAVQLGLIRLTDRLGATFFGL